MKLYTEEQVIQMIEKSRETGLTAEYLILVNKGIELPSDEEIIAKSKQEPDNSDIETAARIGYVAGAKWLREKIQGGNK